jgi:glycosyltransferase involved in cell wall biosynthesis
VHNADLHVPTANRLKATVLREVMRRMCTAIADRTVGISQHTLDTFLDQDRHQARDAIVYYGIDTTRFRHHESRRALTRTQLAILPTQRVLLFAGRMVWYKNPLFVLDMLEHLVESHPETLAVFAGVGPLQHEVTRQAEVRGLSNKVRVLGWRDDAPDLMAAADAFVFPRSERRTHDVGQEGLGLTVIEAQAAGLPSFLSLAIPQDAIVVPSLCRVQSVDNGPAAWADDVNRVLHEPAPNRSDAMQTVEASRFGLEQGYNDLLRQYVE